MTRRSPRAALAVLALFATACMDVRTGVALNDDGSGEVVISVAFNETISTMMLAEGATLDEMTDEMRSEMEIPAELADRVEVEFTETDGKIAFEMLFRFDDTGELAESLTSGGDGEGMFTSFELDESDGTWTLDATGDPSTFEDSMGAFGDSASGGGDVDAEMDAFADMFTAGLTVEFSITFPGEVTDSNADNVDGNTATWDLLDSDGALTASAGGGSGGLGAPIVAAVALIAVAAVAAVALMLRRSSSPTPTPAVTHPDQRWAPQTYPHTPAAPQTYPHTPAAPQAYPHTPAAPVSTSRPPAGWYPDPAGSAARRFWDGTRWTDQTS